MKLGVALGIVSAVVLHGGFLLFGGIFFLDDKPDHGTLAVVKLMSPEEIAAEEEEPEAPPPEPAQGEEVLETAPEEVPDAAEMIRSIELASAAASAPELEAASLSAIEAALSGQSGGSSDFAQSLALTSGGRIGGTGSAAPLAGTMESAFSLAEIDQKPRVLFQSAPNYPASMRGKKVEGVVSVLFVVGPDGSVGNPRAESSSHAAFEKPALDAVKNWKFEPAVKAGQRVACKMRVSVRFPRS